MIDLAELNRELQGTGCSAIREEIFFSFSSITGSTHRLLCASESALKGNAVWPTGFSFWIHEGQGLVFVGVWSGMLYHLPEPERAVFLCKELCATRDRPEKGSPVRLPQEIVDKYAMQEVEVLDLADKNATVRDYLDASPNKFIDSDKRFPYTEREFVRRIENEIDSVQKDEKGNLQLRNGSCHAFTRFCDTPGDETTLAIVFRGALRETEDQVRMLAALEKSLALALFDGAWGGRIDLTDAYYASPRVGVRPEHPMGAWED